MQWRCRQEIEDALWEAARAQLPANALERKRLLQSITERSALYTTERDLLPEVRGHTLPASDLAARALFFGIADSVKISIPLSELAGRDLLPKGTRWRVLDLGAGAGAMGLGIASFIADHHPGVGLEIDAVDFDEQALSLYSAALSNLSLAHLNIPDARIRVRSTSTVGLDIAPAHYDLVVLGSVLNELRPSEQTALVSAAMQGVAVGGSLIIIEPALRETSRGLHVVRDHLIETGVHVVAPCTRQIAPCPALTDARDWCHEDRAVVLPSRARQMAQATGLRDGGLKFSYLVARSEATPLVPIDDSSLALRVVSQPQKGKGQRECFVCSDVGRQKMRLLKRNRDGGNRLFDRSKRGDVLVTTQEAVEPGAKLEIGKGQPIALHHPAS